MALYNLQINFPNFSFKDKNPDTRIILGISVLFLHFPKAKIQIVAGKNTRKQFPIGKINLKIQRNCAKTSKIFIINFISPIVLCVSYELHYLLSTFDGVRSYSFREDIQNRGTEVCKTK